MKMERKSGKVYLIGCGPGSPDLMTLRAVKALREADVILYDRLIDPSILKFSRKAKKVYIGKEVGESSKQARINELMYLEAAKGKTVARLKNGDPMIFGRGGEELLYLRSRGISVEVIPGLSSATSIPSLLKIPLTQRGVASRLIIFSGHQAKEGNLKHGRSGETVVVLMGVGNLRSVVKKLVANGKKRSALCAIISSGSTEKERLLVSPLSRAEEMARVVGIKSPAVLVVGDVVRSLLNFRGMSIAFFRPIEEISETERAVKLVGGIPKVYGVCEIDFFDAEKLRAELSKKWDAVVFMSKNGVRAFANVASGDDFIPIAVGERTKAELEKLGFRRILLPREHDSRGVEELIRVRGLRRVLALRSSAAEGVIRGAKNVVAYSIKHKRNLSSIKRYLREKIDFTVLTSVAILKMLLSEAEKKGLREELVKKMNRTFVISLSRKITIFSIANKIKVNYELEKPSLNELFKVV